VYCRGDLSAPPCACRLCAGVKQGHTDGDIPCQSGRYSASPIISFCNRLIRSLNFLRAAFWWRTKVPPTCYYSESRLENHRWSRRPWSISLLYHQPSVVLRALASSMFPHPDLQFFITSQSFDPEYRSTITYGRLYQMYLSCFCEHSHHKDSTAGYLKAPEFPSSRRILCGTRYYLHCSYISWRISYNVTLRVTSEVSQPFQITEVSKGRLWSPIFNEY
jgi:hypothetical protein